MHQTRRNTITALVVAASALALTACSSALGDDAGAEAPAPSVRETIAIAPGDTLDTTAAPTAAPSTAPTTTVAPTTTAPTTTAPTTTAPTTTAAPTTTQPRRTTTTSTLPSNVRPVKPMKDPLVPMGQSSGSETSRLQERLLQLGFWLNGVDGSYGHTTTQAVMAFQKYMGLDATGSVDDATAMALSALDVKPHGYSNAGDLIEVDKSRQLLFVVRGGQTEWVFNTSTGSGVPYESEDKNTPGEIVTGDSQTPDGLYRVDRERPEGWWEGDLGEIYRPKYFRGGIAVHGSNSIPNYPASHGCVRLSVPAMDFFWEQDIMPMGTTVWVHEGV